jgi:hypothetical protein
MIELQCFVGSVKGSRDLRLVALLWLQSPEEARQRECDPLMAHAIESGLAPLCVGLAYQHYAQILAQKPNP